MNDFFSFFFRFLCSLIPKRTAAATTTTNIQQFSACGKDSNLLLNTVGGYRAHARYAFLHSQLFYSILIGIIEARGLRSLRYSQNFAVWKTPQKLVNI